MDRLFIEIPKITSEEKENISQIPNIDTKATEAKTKADSVQDQMNALTSAFIMEATNA